MSEIAERDSTKKKKWIFCSLVPRAEVNSCSRENGGIFQKDQSQSVFSDIVKYSFLLTTHS